MMKHIGNLIFLCVLPALTITAQNRPSSDYMELTPDRKLSYAEKIIESYYIDDIDGSKIAEEGIIAMLKTLDPHSSYSDPDETKELTQPLDGNFSGIGIQFNMLNDTLFVIQTTSGGPSEKVGLLPGDKILKADTVVISGRKRPNSDILKTLRGPKGTTVNVEVMRKGVAEPIMFRIERDDIPINSVDAAFMADDHTGYIRIARFAESTSQEFADALSKLRKKGMKNLIIDLEDNGGGYLGSAVEVASKLLKRGDMVTYTESPKMGRSDYRVNRGGDFTSGKIVVMVNQYSASASEILSGAIQDNDRGLIVGRRTFGKGLVQRPFPFPDGSMIKLTVSRYHTPSGRSIQKPYESGNAESYEMDMKHRYENGEFYSADNITFPDSLKYTTLKNSRVVYGGGGIMPDLFVPVDTSYYSDYYRDLVAKGLVNRFCITYVDNNRSKLKADYPTEDVFIDRFEVTPEMLSGLVSLGEKDGIAFNEEQYGVSKDMMAVVLKALIGRDLFENSTYFRIAPPIINPVYKAALELINSDRYDELLNPK